MKLRTLLELPPPKGKIFICYRREDTLPSTGRLCDRLSEWIPIGDIFRDSDSIGVGENFASRIHEAIAQCTVVLVMIGPEWLNFKNSAGMPRLENPNDYVRNEIEIGLAQDTTVMIPVLVNGARMPHKDELAQTLQPLTELNALQLRDGPDYNYDVQVLKASIAGASNRRRSRLWCVWWAFMKLLDRSPRLSTIVGIVLALLSIASISFYLEDQADEPNAEFRSLDISDRAGTIICGEGDNEVLQIFEPATGLGVLDISLHDEHSEEGQIDLCLSSRSDVVACVGLETIEFRNSLSGEVINNIRIRRALDGQLLSPIRDYCFAGPDDERFATLHANGKIRIWNVVSGELTSQITFSEGLDLLGKKRRMYAASDDQLWVCLRSQITRIDLASGTTLPALANSDGKIKKLIEINISPDRSICGANSGHEIILRKTFDGTELKALKHGTAPLGDFSFTRDGNYLFAFLDDRAGDVLVWNIASGHKSVIGATSSLPTVGAVQVGLSKTLAVAFKARGTTKVSLFKIDNEGNSLSPYMEFDTKLRVTRDPVYARDRADVLSMSRFRSLPTKPLLFLSDGIHLECWDLESDPSLKFRVTYPGAWDVIGR